MININQQEGGYSRLLRLSCRKCETLIALYQKDGPGHLLRLYFDRIFAPKDLVGLQVLPINRVSVLKCKKCHELVGVPYIYAKEKRKAFRLFQDAALKKIEKVNRL